MSTYNPLGARVSKDIPLNKVYKKMDIGKSNDGFWSFKIRDHNFIYLVDKSGITDIGRNVLERSIKLG